MGLLDRIRGRKDRQGSSASETGTKFIYTSPEVPELMDKSFDCPRCGLHISDTTPKFAVSVCTCGAILHVNNYELE